MLYLSPNNLFFSSQYVSDQKLADTYTVAKRKLGQMLAAAGLECKNILLCSRRLEYRHYFPFPRTLKSHNEE